MPQTANPFDAAKEIPASVPDAYGKSVGATPAQDIGSGGNAVPLKAQVGGNIGPLNENEGTTYTLKGDPAAGVDGVDAGSSKHTIG